MLNLFFILFTLSMSKSASTSVNLYSKRLQPGQFPYLIQFQTVSACGGVLLTPDWVLTAAQCVMFKRSAIFVDRPSWTDPIDPPIGVKATYIHPNYDFYSQFQDYEHNVALLKLSDSYIVSKLDPPLQIGPLRIDDSYSSCLIFGWQSTVFPNSRVFAKPVQYAEVLPNTWKICTYAHGMYGAISNRENIFCAMIESEEGLKTCAGNPGSPIVCENQYGRKILLGIASWTNYSFYCDGLPAYLSVAPFSSWIYKLILSTDQPPLSNDTSFKQVDARNDKFSSDSAPFQETESSSETEQFGDHFGKIKDYKEFRRHYEDPSFADINDDPHFYVISGSEMNILSPEIVLWIILTQMVIICAFS